MTSLLVTATATDRAGHKTSSSASATILLPAGFPNASNTGVPTNVVLPAAVPGFRTSRDGQVIDSLNINGSVYIDHNNVMMTRSKVKGSGGSTWAVDIGRNGPVTNFRISDCTLDGNRSDQGGIRSQSNGSSWIGSRLNIYNGENAARLGGNCSLLESWLHSFASSSSAPHYDGIEVYEGKSILIQHNYIDLDQNETSAINIQGDFAAVSGVQILNNWVGGGGWTMNIRGTDTGANPVSGVVISGNTFGRKGGFGYIVDTATGTTGSGNIDSTGKYVSI